MSDRPTLDEIEVTPEMIEAGIGEIESRFMSLLEPSDPEIFQETVVAIFTAMLASRAKSFNSIGKR